MSKMNEKLTELFIGILWFQNCGKHFRSPEVENSRSRIGFNTFHGPVLQEFQHMSYCTFVLFKDTLVGIW